MRTENFLRIKKEILKGYKPSSSKPESCRIRERTRQKVNTVYSLGIRKGIYRVHQDPFPVSRLH